MKHITFLLFFISINSFSQNNEILGTWKPFAMNDGTLYMNVETDSFSLYKELIYTNQTDSIKLDQLLEYSKMI